MTADASGKWWDEPWTLVEGCTPVSEGCTHCWAATATCMRRHQSNPAIRQRYGGLTNRKGAFDGRVRLMNKDLDKPLRRRKPTVYAIWNDLFHPSVPNDFIDYVMWCCRATSQRHIFVVLTKRPERIAEVESSALTPDCVPFNVVLGTSIENQAAADKRLPHLIPFGIKSYRTVVSIEPLLGPVVLPDEFLALGDRTGIIVGGETGPGARRIDSVWVGDLKAQCDEAGVCFFFKQWGHNIRRDSGRKLLGKTWNALPWRRISGKELQEC